MQLPELLDKVQPVTNEDGKVLSESTRPGLSTLDGDSAKTEKYFQGILKFIKKHLSEEDIRNSSVFVLGTAGMRLLKDRVQSLIIEQTTDLFRNEGKFSKVKVDVITGAEEGMFMWLTINSRLRYLSGGSDFASTIGVIEMGGASVQVTYQLPIALEKLMEHRIGFDEARIVFQELLANPNIAKEKDGYTLVSSTFLGLGSNKAREAYLDMLIVDELKRTPVGYTLAHISDTVFGKRRNSHERDVYIEVVDPCLPITKESSIDLTRPRSMLTPPYEASSNDMDSFKVIVHGKSDYNKCYALVNRLLIKMRDEKMFCPDPKTEACSMSMLHSRFVPFDRLTFYGIGDLAHTLTYVGVPHGDYDSDLVKERTRDFCNLTHEQVLDMNPAINKFDSTRSLLECFKAVWVDSILTVAFGMRGDSGGFKIFDGVSGSKLEWTLGAALEKALVTETAIASNPDNWIIK